MVNLFTGVFENPYILALKKEIAMSNLLESEQIDAHISGTNQYQYAEHLLWLSKFTDCKEVKSVPSKNKRKVQGKTNKSSKSSQSDVQAKV